MSEDAFESFRQAREAQYQRNEARRILTRVLEAREAPQVSAGRWPFELLQNAIDSGPREGRDTVTVQVTWLGKELVVDHDGHPFAMEELAALLSGGSSKDFESERTTGRFGTGFLVTHVLSVETAVDGLLTVGASVEQFGLVLDRSGSEEDILANIDNCNDAIRSATPLESIDEVWSASFAYRVSDTAVVDRGVASLRQALPYVYGTSPLLGELTIVADGETEQWCPGPVVSINVSGGLLHQRDLHVARGDEESTFRILRFAVSDDASMLVLLKGEADGSWAIVPLEADRPKIYRQYPLRQSTFLPTAFVIDGRFDPDQERAKVLMSEQDRRALDAAFEAAVVAIRHVVDEGYGSAESMAFAARVSSGFEAEDVAETAYWNGALERFADAVSRVPMIRSRDSVLPASGGDRIVDFLVPRFTVSSPADETTMERLHALGERVRGLDPPIAQLSDTWTRISEGWAGLGLTLNRVAVADIARRIASGASSISEFDVDGDPYVWLACFLDVVGECWKARTGVDTAPLDGLLPDQGGVLRPTDSLRRDVGIDGSLKNLAERAGLDPRSSLLSEQLSAEAERAGEHASEALKLAIPEQREHSDLQRHILEHLRKTLPEGPVADDQADAIDVTAQLLAYLWARGGVGEQASAQAVPLLSRERIVHWSSERRMVAPVAAWPEAARPFVDAYPPNRVLADVYADPGLVEAMGAWAMSFPKLLVHSSPELREQRLAAICTDGNPEGVVVRDQSLSQLALLQPEVLNRCQEDPGLAAALLGLVLRFVAPSDAAWRESRSVKGRRESADVDLAIRPALWLADVRSKAWVPIASDEQRPSKAIADATTLRPLLDPAWLEGNEAAVDLLTRCFGFDELDLRLLGIPDEVQQAVRHDLARVLEAGGGDPAFYSQLADQVEQRQSRERDIGRYRRLGFAVQAAVRAALEGHGLKAELVDCGYDFEVSLDSPIEEASLKLTVGPYLVEVKATTRGPVRLTPTQAQTSVVDPARFVLCAVDLRGVDPDRLDLEWTAGDVEPLVHMVAGIGLTVATTWALVDQARRSKIGLRNDANLRYEVPASAWQGGSTLRDWIEEAF